MRVLAIAAWLLFVVWAVAQPFVKLGLGVEIPVAVQVIGSIALGVSGFMFWSRAGSRDSAKVPGEAGGDRGRPQSPE